MVHVYLAEEMSLTPDMFPVWQKLEEENPEFFRAYHLRLMVKNQIERFNDLLERQIETMQLFPTESIPLANRSQIRESKHNILDCDVDLPGDN